MISEVDSIAIVVNRVQHRSVVNTLLHSLLKSVETFASNPENVIVIYPITERTSKTEVDDFLDNPESRGHSLMLHNPNSKSSLKYIGDTPTYSTPVQINEGYLCADMKIGLGEIQPDVFYGATGGRMSVIPSVSGRRTINRNTKLQATKQIGQFKLETPSCKDMLEISQLAGLDFIVNVVSDWQGNLAHIMAGNSFTSWMSGVKSAAGLAKADYSRHADIAIVSAGGSPNDLTLYDAIDCLYSAYEVTEHGGSIVLVAECSRDVGAKGFLHGMSEYSTDEDIIAAAETNYEFGMEKARFFWNVLRTRNVVICSRLRDSLVEERFHCTAVKDPQEGLEAAKNMLASCKKVTILDDGIRTTPKLVID